MAEYVFLNGEFVRSEEARVSVYDGGLLHGVGLFETMRSYGGRVFRLEDHLERLYDSAGKLHLSISQKRQDIVEAIEDLLQKNELEEARVRLTVTRGDIRQVREEETAPGTMIITAGQMTAYPMELYKYGMRVIISAYKQNPDDVTSRHKTTNYFGRLLALQEAKQKQRGEALWFTTTNRLAEGCVSNIFLIKDDILMTPPLDTPVLAGITRKVVLEMARENEIKCEEKELLIKDLLDASEIILTNSIMELMPVCQVEAHKVASERPGAVYKKLHELYQEKVKKECE